MADTQWPRYEVFLQEKEDDPFQDVGSVHAPDPEMAMLNARDVFVRRPSCSALWIVPASQIFSKTAQELMEQPVPLPDTSSLPQTYCIFTKIRQTGTQIFTGQVEAHSPEEAVRIAIATLPTNRPPLVWWAVPASAVRENNPQDAPAFFDPSQDKPFRLSSDFHTVSAMRQIKWKSTPAANPGDSCPPGELQRGET